MKVYPQIGYQIKEQAGKPYLPANGSEGAAFEESFCETCAHYDEGQCKVLCFAWAESSSPEEWVRDSFGRPVCKKWEFDGNQESSYNPEDYTAKDFQDLTNSFLP